MSNLIDDDIIEPSIDPVTKKIAIRHLKGVNAAGSRTRIQIRDFDPVFTDEPASLGGSNSAPSPLEMALASLVGCDGVIINGVATAMQFDYAGVSFSCESQIDVRGPKGVPGVRPYFESVTLEIIVFTDESDERFRRLEKNVEFRCPIMNLMRAANVQLDATWIKRPKGEFQGLVDD